MAFKLRNQGGTFKTMGSSPSPTKATTGSRLAQGGATANAPKAPKASNEDWSKANETSKTQNKGVSLNDLVAKRKTLEKGSNEYNVNQNAINKAMGNSKRYDVEEAKAEAPTTTFTGDRDGKRTETTKDATGSSSGKEKTTEVDYNRGGKKKETRTSENKSTYNPETGEGSSGLGNVKTTQKTQVLNRDKDRRRSVSVGDMGTDDTSDDTKIVNKRGIRNNKTKMKNEKGTAKVKVNRKTGEVKAKTRLKGELIGKTAEQRMKKILKKATKTQKKLARKAGEVKGSKAPKGTTYDPSDDTSNMPSAMKNMKTGKYNQSFAKKKKY